MQLEPVYSTRFSARQGLKHLQNRAADSNEFQGSRGDSRWAVGTDQKIQAMLQEQEKDASSRLNSRKQRVEHYTSQKM